MVQSDIDFLGEAGVRDLILVTGSDHVDDFRRYFGDKLRYAQQERAGGIAEALGLTRDFADGDRVVVMLADNIFGGPIIADGGELREARRPAPACCSPMSVRPSISAISASRGSSDGRHRRDQWRSPKTTPGGRTR